MRLPLLVSVPHAGLSIPPEVEGKCILTPQQIAADGDEQAAEIYALDGEVEIFVTTPIARAIVDLNRAEDDRRADGVIKTHTCWNEPVYASPPTEAVVEQLLERYHRPYHRNLTAAADGRIPLAIDGHTMAAVGPPIGPMAGLERPPLCLSDVDGTSCPPEVFDRLRRCLEDAFELDVAVNHPFKGGYITRTHAAEMPWVQLELSRGPFVAVEEKRRRLLRALTEFCRPGR
ncbi:MAG: N-formylglutamate amidohydrolase [Acidobacteriota bacterium]|nr:N-formylglutamate amidohydrolase [Acidobacteriota bacterium]